jgi:hypothetical protein
VLLPEETQVGLVNEGGGLEGLAGRLSAHVAVRQAAQFGVNERHQRVEGGGVALAPGEQEPGNVARGPRGQESSSGSVFRPSASFRLHQGWGGPAATGREGGILAQVPRE